MCLVHFSSYTHVRNNCVLFNFFFFQEKLKEKDSQLEENTRLLSEKQGTVSQLEQDLSNCRLELTEREKRISDSLQAEVC